MPWAWASECFGSACLIGFWAQAATSGVLQDGPVDYLEKYDYLDFQVHYVQEFVQSCLILVFSMRYS